MEDFRSRSCANERTEMEGYGSRVAPSSSGLHHLRCYSTSQQTHHAPKELKLNGKSTFGSSSSSKGGWILNDPELKRKKRVAGYKAYTVEGKVKGSLRKSFRWFKDRCTQVVDGWW